MKASQLRIATDLITNLDNIKHDIEVFNDKTREFTYVSCHAGQRGKLRWFTPLRAQYLAFLRDRKDKVEALLKQIGVDVET